MRPPTDARLGQRGVTYLEMIATATIMLILASAILPMAHVARQRQRELELRRALREIRTAIDKYKDAVDRGMIGGTDVKLGSEGYPPDLDTLVNGVNQVGRTEHKLKFLRRVPVDPITHAAEWGQRCYQDEAKSDSWCGSNVYDVYTNAHGKALDGTDYHDW